MFEYRVTVRMESDNELDKGMINDILQIETDGLKVRVIDPVTEVVDIQQAAKRLALWNDYFRIAQAQEVEFQGGRVCIGITFAAERADEALKLYDARRREFEEGKK